MNSVFPFLSILLCFGCVYGVLYSRYFNKGVCIINMFGL